MKKFLLTAIVVASFGVLAHGEIVHTPQGEAQSLATADYGGVLVSTGQFFIGLTTVPACTAYPCRGVVYGVFFSTGFTTDFVRVFDATSAVTSNQASEVARIYNVGSSTTGATIGGIGCGFSGVGPKPIRFGKGLFWQTNTAGYNTVDLLFYKEP